MAPQGASPNVDVDQLRFVLGAVLLVACFGTAMNWSYRWVFALWLLPGLLRQGSSLGVDPRIQRIGRWLLVLLLWWDGVASVFFNFGPGRSLGLSPERYGIWTWALIQPLHWIFFCGLAFFAAVWLGQSVMAARSNLFRR
jgi:hypothetical protein